MHRQLILSILALSFAFVPSRASAREFFPHEAHIKYYIYDVTCDMCHVAGAKTIIPDKKVCLQCHQDGFPEKVRFVSPRTHGPTWALTHGSEAKSGVFDCAGCHEQAFCLECHRVGPADEMGRLGNNMINVHRSDFFVTHPISARTDQRLCVTCHETRFCYDCHSEFRSQIGQPGSPSHRRVFDLGLDGNIDKIHAGFDGSIPCDTCHLQGSVAPDLHTWSVGHGREARRSLVTCQTCHPEGEICLKCHSAKSGVVGFNPHGKGWKDRMGRLNDASNGKTCKKCH